jgi:uncharacterized membrane protein YkgB
MIEKLDRAIQARMRHAGEPALRISLFIIFFWFGLLKPLGRSAAAPLVIRTVDWMPLLSPEQWLAVIGWWEVLIGICFLFRRTTRAAIALMFLQMTGTFMPLFILPGVTFQPGGVPFLPTLEGQYIIKNLMILSGALIIGGNLGSREKIARPGLTCSAQSGMSRQPGDQDNCPGDGADPVRPDKPENHVRLAALNLQPLVTGHRQHERGRPGGQDTRPGNNSRRSQSHHALQGHTAALKQHERYHHEGDRAHVPVMPVAEKGGINRVEGRIDHQLNQPDQHGHCTVDRQPHIG